jgi:hypothetical protein
MLSVVLTDELSTEDEDISNNYLVYVVLLDEWSTEDEDSANNYLVSVVLTEEWSTEDEDIANNAETVKDGEERNKVEERGLHVQIIVQYHQNSHQVTYNLFLIRTKTAIQNCQLKDKIKSTHSLKS